MGLGQIKYFGNQQDFAMHGTKFEVASTCFSRRGRQRSPCLPKDPKVWTELVSVVAIVVLVVMFRPVAIVQRSSGRALEIGEGFPPCLLSNLFPHFA